MRIGNVARYSFAMPGLFHRWRHPRRCYVVSAIARSGSNLLTDGLTSTRRAGRPNQFFWPPFEDHFRSRNGLRADIPFADYVRAIVRQTSTSNAVFGFKLMAWYLDEFLARLRATSAFGEIHDTDLALLQNAFPRLRFIQIARRNKLRQAISKARALQSGLWKVLPNKTDSGEAVFDRGLIARCLKEAEAGEKTWSEFFERVEVKPFQVEYEQLCADYEGVLRSVLDFLRIAWPRSATLAPVTQRQSDAISAEWERRYLAG